jgi:hypothetical protein
MTAMLRVPRTRGVGSGLLLILLGAWGALIPFVGPYFHFAYTPDTAWTWTWGRFFLEIVPGVAAALGGLILMISAFRPVAMFGAALAAAAGAWFVVGSLLGPVWASTAALGAPGGVPAALDPGQPTGGPLHMAAEHLSFFTALGVVIVFVAGVALGRIASVTSGIAPVEEPAVPAVTEPIERVPAGSGLPFRRRTTESGPVTTEPGPAKTEPVPAGTGETRPVPANDTTQTIG